MSYDAALAPTLFDLLGRAWTLSAGVEAACFNRDASAVAYAAGGTLAIVPVADPERPETRMRIAADTGRATIQPRKTPPRPPATVSGVVGPVAPYGEKSFVTGSARGGLVSVTPRGQAVPLAVALDGPLAALARDPCSGALAAGAGAAVTVLPDDLDAAPLRFETEGPVVSLAFASRGDLLGIGGAEGLLLREGRLEAARLALPHPPARLAWSPDGAFLACGFEAPGFALIRLADLRVEVNADYPTAVASFGWSAAAGAFVTSGAFRTIAWSLGPEGLADPLEAGRTGLVIVERVAASPDRPLVASGYANGLLCVNKIGAREEMPLRHDGGAVRALVWSPDGAHLAMGDADGIAALISFPANLFKRSEQPS